MTVVGAEAEERAQFMLLMRARGIRDISLLRALERAPRALFMPQRYGDIAARDIALPIGCGQTAPPPSVVAAMIEALAVERAHRVFEIGGGTGYATSLITQLAGEVLTVERCQSLALEAASRLESLAVDNAQVAWADGLSASLNSGPFDRIIVHALIDEPPQILADLLSPDGVLVAARLGEGEAGKEQRIVRFARDEEGAFAAVDLGPARSFARLAEGLAKGL